MISIKFYNILSYIFFLFSFSNLCIADTHTFEKYYSFSNIDDSGFDVEVDDFGNIYICGYSTNPFYSGVLFKLNPTGIIIWHKIFNRNDLVFYDMQLSKDNFIYLCGSYDSAFVTKVDLNGNLIWFKTFFNFDTRLYKIIELNKNLFITSGETWPNNGIIIKFDESGNMLDTINLGYKSIQSVRSVENISLNNFVALKYKYFNGNVFSIISEYDDNLNLINEIELTESILQIIKFTNGFMLCGFEFDTTANIHKALFIKINPSFKKEYKNLSEESGFSFTPFNLFNKNFIYYFETQTGDSLRINYIMTDSVGNTIKKLSRNFYLEDSFLYRSISSKGNFLYFTGEKYFQIDGSVLQDIILTKTDKDFNFKIINIEESVTKLKDNDVSIYPNPFNSMFKIRISGNLSNNIFINIYDISGRKIYSKLYNDYNSLNGLDMAIDFKDFSSGVYFLEVQNNLNKIFKKIINMK